MTSLSNQLKMLKKDLGKQRFLSEISEEVSFFRSVIQLFFILLMIVVSLILWYGFYWHREDYWTLFCALFLSMSWVLLYDLYRVFIFKTIAFIGDRGIALLKVRRKNKQVIKATSLFFDAIDELVIDVERHYAVGVGGEWVEYLCLKEGKKKVFKIDANHSQHYDEFKLLLSKYYEIFKVRRNKE